MTDRLIIRMVVSGLLFLLVAGYAAADDVRPVQVQVKEMPSGLIDVQWSVPKVIPPQTMPSPWLPEQCQPVGERTFVDQPTAWMTRQAYRCPDGLAGQWLGIRYPAYNIGLSTLLRVELLSGDRYAHMLDPGRDRWQIPAAGTGGLADFYRDAQGGTLAGIEHFFRGWVHLVFLVVVCLFGGLGGGIRLATAFFMAQLATAAGCSLLGVGLGAPVAAMGVALGTVLLARQALRPPGDRHQLTVLAACAGALHGLGLQDMVPPFGQDADPGLSALLLFVLGMDAALLLSVAVVSGIRRFMPSGIAGVPLARVAAYGAAGIAVALTLGALIGGPAAETEDPERKLELPGILSSSGTMLPGSRRLASNTPDAAFQSFVSIAAFEVRHEVLVRLRDVAARIGVEPGPELAIEYQDVVKQRIGDLVFEHMTLQIDGEQVEPTSERIDFLTLDDKGVLPRPVPVPESIENAWIGVTAVYLMPTTSQSLQVAWEFIAGSAEIPATVTDPETTRSVLLNPREPVLRWENELAEDPVPVVTTTAVEPRKLIIPLWSLLPLAAALVFLLAAVGRRRPVLSLTLSRVMLVAAVMLGPAGNLAMALPSAFGSAPSTNQARRIIARVLPNIYRSFEFREEAAVYDRLSLAVTGDELTTIYLGHRRVLEMEERGGAQARVEAVEVIDVESIASADDGGFSALATWTVGGTVTHFGHRHFRQNRYDARVTLVPDGSIWKIRQIEVFSEERQR